jgi:hypothetical protein
MSSVPCNTSLLSFTIGSFRETKGSYQLFLSNVKGRGADGLQPIFEVMVYPFK